MLFVWLVSDPLKVIGSVDGEVAALRELLASETVGVLVCATLPRRPRLAEVHQIGQWQRRFHDEISPLFHDGGEHEVWWLDDFKPANVLVNGVVHVIDFDWARLKSRDLLVRLAVRAVSKLPGKVLKRARTFLQGTARTRPSRGLLPGRTRARHPNLRAD